MIKTMITAHSGCDGTPDNSLESIRKGIELGADCVEIDIRMDPRGTLCLTHNELEDYSNAVLLETALRTIADSNVAVNCDLKEERLLYPVLEAAEAAGIPRERLVFSGSVDVGLLKRDPTIVKRVRIFLNLEQILIYKMKKNTVPAVWIERIALFDKHFLEIAALVRRLGVECINPNYKVMTLERIAACHARGIGLSLWTVNDEADQRRLLRTGLVNMTTRNAATALKIRNMKLFTMRNSE